MPFSVWGSIPGREAKSPHTSQSKNQNIKKKKEKKQYCSKFNKDSKNGPHQKKIFRKRKCHVCLNIDIKGIILKKIKGIILEMTEQSPLSLLLIDTGVWVIQNDG